MLLSLLLLHTFSLLCHGIFCGLQWKLCSSTWSTTSPSFSQLCVRRVISLTFFPLPPPLLCSVLPFLKHIFPEVPPSRLWGSAVPCDGLVGAGWNWLCPAQSSLTSSHRDHPAAPTASTWITALNIVCCITENAIKICNLHF